MQILNWKEIGKRLKNAIPTCRVSFRQNSPLVNFSTSFRLPEYLPMKLKLSFQMQLKAYNVYVRSPIIMVKGMGLQRSIDKSLLQDLMTTKKLNSERSATPILTKRIMLERLLSKKLNGLSSDQSFSILTFSDLPLGHSAIMIWLRSLSRTLNPNRPLLLYHPLSLTNFRISDYLLRMFSLTSIFTKPGISGNFLLMIPKQSKLQSIFLRVRSFKILCHGSCGKSWYWTNTSIFRSFMLHLTNTVRPQ